MKKESIMFGVFGLVVGLVIGFMGANSLNRSQAGQIAQAPAGSTSAPAGNPNLPADHPPIGTTGADQPTSGAPSAQVTAAIDKAKQQPQNYEAQMTAADLYYQIQRFEDAAKFYEAASRLKPADTEPMIKAGNAYFDGEKYELAEKWYVQALQKNPKDINVRTDLGLTFFLRTPRDIDRAIKEYKTSLETDANHEITLQNLALAYTENGDKEALVKTLDRLKTVNPNNPVIKKAESN